MFATLAKFAGARCPTDRPMDSIDQSDFFLGKSEKSAREGFPIWCVERLTAVKWGNWKLHFFRAGNPVRHAGKIWDAEACHNTTPGATRKVGGLRCS